MEPHRRGQHHLHGELAGQHLLLATFPSLLHFFTLLSVLCLFTSQINYLHLIHCLLLLLLSRFSRVRLCATP